MTSVGKIFRMWKEVECHGRSWNDEAETKRNQAEGSGRKEKGSGGIRKGRKQRGAVTRMEEEWEGIPASRCRDLVEVPRRLAAVIAAKGGYTKY